MIRSLTALSCACVLLLTLGCGTRGPLYLPQPEETPEQEREQEAASAADE